jgi:glycosyltransferase involved in cell wall biosynthesis
MHVKNPLISVLIPSYNHERFVEETIRSIWSQPYKNVEIIVVDDCSIDGSVALLRNLKSDSPCHMDVFVNATQSGPAATINRTISLAKGDLLAIIASDDIFTDDPFSRRVEMFEQDDDLQIIYGNGKSFDANGIRGTIHKKVVKELLSKTAPDILEYLYTNTSPLFIQAALLKKNIILQAGCLDASLKADDWQMNTRIFKELVHSGGGFAFLDEPVFYYRIHGANLYRNFQRQTALKLEFIDKVTPEPLKNKARANILYGVAVRAAKEGKFADAIDLFRQSRQNNSTTPKKTIKFFSKLIYSATVGAVTRKFLAVK